MADTLTVLAVDPGFEQSAYVVFDGTAVLAHDIVGNEALLDTLPALIGGGAGRAICVSVVFEQIEGMGMPVGREVMETIFWTGRFYQRGLLTYPGSVHRLTRRAVKLHLCGTSAAKDANVRMALLDRFGGKTVAVGRKKTPGPLWGVKQDEWSALALGVTWWDQHATGRDEAS